MAVDLTDPESTLLAYESVLQNETNWLLLTYSDINPDQLSLSAYGSQGLPELKSKIDNLDEVFIAFYREEVNGTPGFILINYVPHLVTGVRRARALMHSRRIGALFNSHQNTLTVDNLGNLTNAAIRRALEHPESPLDIPMGRSISQPSASIEGAFPSNPLAPQLQGRSSSESYASPPPASIAKAGRMFSKFLHRKKKQGEVFDDEAPPPTPPKDKGPFSMNQQHSRYMSTITLTMPTNTHNSVPQQIPRRARANSLSEFAVISHSSSSDEVIIEPRSQPSRDGQPYVPQKIMVEPLPLPSKWMPETPRSVLDPAERARRRIEAQRRKEIQDREAILEEADRQARLKHRKEELLKQEKMEEEWRKASLENELRRITAERRRRAQMEREAEERRREEFEEKKRVEKERRLEEHRRLEEWRRDQARLADDAARRAEEARRQEEAERRAQIKLVEARVRNNANAESLVTGWVTIQSAESLTWKRRYFKFDQSTILFYRNPKEISQVLDAIELRGLVKGLREWDEGFEDLEAIPHSFAVEFNDGRTPWAMFADSEEEKFKLLGLLHHAAGLRD